MTEGEGALMCVSLPLPLHKFLRAKMEAALVKSPEIW